MYYAILQDNMKSWTKPFVHKNHFYEALFLKQPYRQKLECCVDVKGRRLRVANQDIGERDLIERMKAEIDKALQY